jgi:hypothetical protein
MSTGEELGRRLSSLPGLTQEEIGRLYASLVDMEPEQRNRYFPSSLSDAAIASSLKQKFLQAPAAAGMFFVVLDKFLVILGGCVVFFSIGVLWRKL